jgi:hypothetical protein
MGMIKHPGENDLALLAGGETGHIRRFFFERHVRSCPDCHEKVAEYHDLRRELADMDMPDLNWNYLAMEMRANIRVGLEAGACVRTTRVSTSWGPRLAAAIATLLVLVGASFFFTDSGLHRAEYRTEPPASVLQATSSGIELRKGAASFSILDHQGVRADQTVSAQGVIEARYIETGSVTINNVYMQQ